MSYRKTQRHRFTVTETQKHRKGHTDIDRDGERHRERLGETERD